MRLVIKSLERYNFFTHGCSTVEVHVHLLLRLTLKNGFYWTSHSKMKQRGIIWRSFCQVRWLLITSSRRLESVDTTIPSLLLENGLYRHDSKPHEIDWESYSLIISRTTLYQFFAKWGFVLNKMHAQFSDSCTHITRIKISAWSSKLIRIQQMMPSHTLCCCLWRPSQSDLTILSYALTCCKCDAIANASKMGGRCKWHLWRLWSIILYAQ